MAIPWDLDLPIFVWSMLRAIGGRKKRASQTPQAIPVDPEYQEIPEEELTQIQRHYLRPLDEQLAALNYRPDCVAVGTLVTQRPPHRSALAAFLHAALTVDIWRQSAE